MTTRTAVRTAETARTKTTAWLAVAFVALEVVDFLITSYIIGHGGVEINPLATTIGGVGKWWYGIVKIVIPTAFSVWMIMKAKTEKTTIAIMAGVTAMAGVVAVWQVAQMITAMMGR